MIDWLPIERDTVTQGALLYAEHGWPVFPCRGKQPYTSDGFKGATSDPVEVARMWRQWPDANVGWPLRDGWFALDVDPRHDGDKSLRALEREHGALPYTLRAATGSGGEHWIYRIPSGVEVRQLAGVRAGLDTRVGGRGYLLIAPSIHPDTSKPYRWHTSVEPSEPPAWLVDLVRVHVVQPIERPQYSPPPSASIEMDKRRRYAEAVLTGCAEDVRGSANGSRNDTLNRAWWRVLKFRDALNVDNARAELAEAARAIGLPEIEIKRTLR